MGAKKVGGENKPPGSDALRRTCFSYKRAEFPTPRSHCVYFRFERARTLCVPLFILIGANILLSGGGGGTGIIRTPLVQMMMTKDIRFLFGMYIFEYKTAEATLVDICTRRQSKVGYISSWSKVERIKSVIFLFFGTIAFCPHLQDAQFSPGKG